MAKTKEAVVETKELAPADAMADLLASLTPEELAELQALTGQNANQGKERIPVIKVNYCDTPDKDGKEIKKGNFVYAQSSKTVEVEVTDEDGEVTTEDRMEDLGVDLGKSLVATVLAYRQQYNFYHDDPKQRCGSQIFSAGEVPVGSTLKHECRGGKCPRRKDGIDNKDKCSAQFIVYLLVDVDGEKKPAMMYVKGSNYFPWNDYLKAAGPIPLFFAPTKMKNKAEKQGTVTYFVTTFDLDVPNAYTAIERESYKTQVKGAIAQMEQHKATAASKDSRKQIAAPGEGLNAVDMGSLPSDDESEIVF